MSSESLKFAFLSCEASIEKLGTRDQTGLSQDTVAKILEQQGPNKLQEFSKDTAIRIFLRQFRGLPIAILVGAAIVSMLIGESEDSYAIIAIVLLNGLLGFVQDYRAESAMAALRKLTSSRATVLRERNWQVLDAEHLVPGDIVSFQAGDRIPADLRIIKDFDLEIDESTLTGESVPTQKTSKALASGNPTLPELTNIAFKGTVATRGRGLGVVIATGMKTELGRIAGFLTEKDSKLSPLQLRLETFSKRLAIIVILLCLALFIQGVSRGETPMRMLMTALSLAVAAIPEALPAVTTILLAFGARAMAQKNALVRKLSAVETLGSVTYICTDKTGTLTENKLHLDAICIRNSIHPFFQFSVNDEHSKWLVSSFALNNDASYGEGGQLIGDPTETALLEAAQRLGLEKSKVSEQLPRVSEVPFSSERMMMTTLHRMEHECILFIKGAPEKILSLCTYELTAAGNAVLDKVSVLGQATKMASSGHRVIACAMRRGFPPEKNSIATNDESDLVFLGFVGLIDPPRQEAKQAIKECLQASINVVMITGDHPTTATAIAKKIGLFDGSLAEENNLENTLTGLQLRNLDDATLAQKIKTVRVYARAAPEDKIRIVNALQRAGEFVAMTGDGVNDAPALKKADIGVSMGKNGTDVAREASQLVLLDDNFATIVAAVKEGRRIFDNIRKFIRYVLTGNSGEIWALLLAQFSGFPLPLLPIQILFVNLLTDGLPGIALSAEPAEKNILNRPPRPPKESIFANGLWQHALIIGFILGLVTLAAFYFGHQKSTVQGQTMAFTVLTLGQLIHVLAIRSESESIFSRAFNQNKHLLSVVVITFGMQIAAIYSPFMNRFLGTQPIEANDFAICIGLSLIIGVASELEKLRIRKLKRVNP